MQILPAIDILNGKVVRLFQGDYEKATYYADDPLNIAKTFANQGFPFLHVIDLAGAKAGFPQVVKEINDILSLGLEVQVGGGIRSLENAREYIAMGVKRIIIGTQALKNPSFIDELLQAFGADAVSVSLDVRNGKLAINGWIQEHPLPIESVLNQLEKQGIKNVIVTDISRDGTMSGVNSYLYKPLVDSFQTINFYAAGGITTQFDIEDLEKVGVTGAIIGRAFYEKGLNV